MSRIEELINRLCPDGVEFKKLGDICSKVNKIKWADNNNHYLYIDLSSVDVQTKQIHSEYWINKENAPSRAQQIIHKGDVLFATTRPTQMRFCIIDKKYDNQICSTGFCVLRPKIEQVLNKWIYYIISTRTFLDFVAINQKGTGYPSITNKEIFNFSIPIPPLEIQQEIVRILDNFTEKTNELTNGLTNELTARKKQYEYYRDKLLTFDKDDDKVKWMKLVEVAKFTYGYTDKAKEDGDVRYIRITDILDNGHLNPQNAKYVNLTQDNTKYLLKEGDVLMARTGATFGKTLYITNDKPAIYASFLIKVSLNNDFVLSKYYWHFSKSSLYWKQANKLVSVGGQQQFNANVVSQIIIPIPPIETQQRIVSILDRFDQLCNDLTAGLPTEIEARRKQYEYYRDKLLTFKEKKA